jgi:hypothetical protein
MIGGMGVQESAGYTVVVILRRGEVAQSGAAYSRCSSFNGKWFAV